jgi:hypothetical protein
VLVRYLDSATKKVLGEEEINGVLTAGDIVNLGNMYEVDKVLPFTIDGDTNVLFRPVYLRERK